MLEHTMSILRQRELFLFVDTEHSHCCSGVKRGTTTRPRRPVLIKSFHFRHLKEISETFTASVRDESLLTPVAIRVQGFAGERSGSHLTTPSISSSEASATVHMHTSVSALLRHQPSGGEEARVTHRRTPLNAQLTKHHSPVFYLSLR